MKKFLKEKNGIIMIGLGSTILISDLIGIDSVLTAVVGIGIILIVEGVDRI